MAEKVEQSMLSWLGDLADSQGAYVRNFRTTFETPSYDGLGSIPRVVLGSVCTFLAQFIVALTLLIAGFGVWTLNVVADPQWIVSLSDGWQNMVRPIYNTVPPAVIAGISFLAIVVIFAYNKSKGTTGSKFGTEDFQRLFNAALITAVIVLFVTDPLYPIRTVIEWTTGALNGIAADAGGNPNATMSSVMVDSTIRPILQIANFGRELPTECASGWAQWINNGGPYQCGNYKMVETGTGDVVMAIITFFCSLSLIVVGVVSMLLFLRHFLSTLALMAALPIVAAATMWKRRQLDETSKVAAGAAGNLAMALIIMVLVMMGPAMITVLLNSLGWQGLLGLLARSTLFAGLTVVVIAVARKNGAIAKALRANMSSVEQYTPSWVNRATEKASNVTRSVRDRAGDLASNIPGVGGAISSLRDKAGSVKDRASTSDLSSLWHRKKTTGEPNQSRASKRLERKFGVNPDSMGEGAVKELLLAASGKDGVDEMKETLNASRDAFGDKSPKVREAVAEKIAAVKAAAGEGTDLVAGFTVPSKLPPGYRVNDKGEVEQQFGGQWSPMITNGGARVLSENGSAPFIDVDGKRFNATWDGQAVDINALVADVQGNGYGAAVPKDVMLSRKMESTDIHAAQQLRIAAYEGPGSNGTSLVTGKTKQLMNLSDKMRKDAGVDTSLLAAAVIGGGRESQRALHRALNSDGKRRDKAIETLVTSRMGKGKGSVPLVATVKEQDRLRELFARDNAELNSIVRDAGLVGRNGRVSADVTAAAEEMRAAAEQQANSRDADSLYSANTTARDADSGMAPKTTRRSRAREAKTRATATPQTMAVENNDGSTSRADVEKAITSERAITKEGVVARGKVHTPPRDRMRGGRIASAFRSATMGERARGGGGPLLGNNPRPGRVVINDGGSTSVS